MPKFENESEKPAHEESVYHPGANRQQYSEASTEKESSNLRSRWRRPRGNEAAAPSENTHQHQKKQQPEATASPAKEQREQEHRRPPMHRDRERSHDRHRHHERSSSSGQKREFEHRHKRREGHEHSASQAARKTSFFQKLKQQIAKLLGLGSKQSKFSGHSEGYSSDSGRRFSGHGGRSDRRHRGGRRHHRHRPHRGDSFKHSEKEKNN